jgi:two-component system response regulator PrrA
VGDLVVDPRRHVATRRGRALEPTRREFELLEVFARYPGQVLSRDQLLTQVWGYSADVETNVVDVFVGYVRRKLEAGGEPRMLHTVRGVGWVMRA